MTDIDFLNLQMYQNNHDKIYHTDIDVLPMSSKMKHYTLHMCKYASYLLTAEIEDDHGLRQRALVDTFVISLAIANTLNQNLTKAMHDFADPNCVPWPKFPVLVGRLAKACEALDHLEDFPFRTTMLETNVKIMAMATWMLCHLGMDVETLYKTRIQEVEQRHTPFNQMRSN